MTFELKRVVVWMSGGCASAVAGKLAIERHSDQFPVLLVNTDTKSEDEDNYRFLNDCGKWLGYPITYISNPKYNNTHEVYEHRNFFKNQYGAVCSFELKKKPRRLFEDLTGDLQIFGYTSDPADIERAHRFSVNNPEVTTWYPLIEREYTKTVCRQIIAKAGIKEPRTYSEGFKNANCLQYGCVKGGVGYWNLIRVKRPDVFGRMAQKERQLGYALCKATIDGVADTPIYLDELPAHWGNYKTEPAFQCGLFCGEY